jgi:hypothetical protein
MGMPVLKFAIAASKSPKPGDRLPCDGGPVNVACGDSLRANLSRPRLEDADGEVCCAKGDVGWLLKPPGSEVGPNGDTRAGVKVVNTLS